MNARLRRLLKLLGTVWLTTGCAAENRLLEPEFSEATGETVVRFERPVVFARDQGGRSAFGREFAYLGALETDRFGRISLELWLGLGTTYGAAARTVSAGPGPELVLEVDGEPLRFAMLADERAGYDVPLPLAESYRAPITEALLRRLAEAERVTVRLERAGTSRSFAHWHGAWPRWDEAGSTLALGFRARVNDPELR